MSNRWCILILHNSNPHLFPNITQEGVVAHNIDRYITTTYWLIKLHLTNNRIIIFHWLDTAATYYITFIREEVCSLTDMFIHKRYIEDNLALIWIITTWLHHFWNRNLTFNFAWLRAGWYTGTKSIWRCYLCTSIDTKLIF